MIMNLSAEKIAGRGLRFARPWGLGQSQELRQKSGGQDLIISSPPNLRICSKSPSFNPSLNLLLTAHFPSAVDQAPEIRVNFAGVKGRVIVRTGTPQFLEDAATIRNWVLKTALTLMGGAEPVTYYREGSEFHFQFSFDTPGAFQGIMENFPPPGDSPDWNKLFLFYERDGKIRELSLLHAWLTYKILGKDANYGEIRSAALSPGLGLKYVLNNLKELNELRRQWKLPALPIRPTFTEIQAAVSALRRQAKQWPGLDKVAETLNLQSWVLVEHLERINQERMKANQVPLYLP